MQSDVLSAQREIEAITLQVNQLVAANEKKGLPEFVQALYQDVALADILQESDVQHAARVAGLWRWIFSDDTLPKVRVFNPPEAGGNWRQDLTYIEILTRDMPFLVDSITVELQRLNLDARLMLHPVISVQRDAAGAATEVRTDRPANMAKESLIHTSISRQPDEALAGIQANLLKVLQDVEIAVTDWSAMRAAVQESSKTLPHAPDNSEEDALLQWLDDGNFVFLGMRDYKLSLEGTVLDRSGLDPVSHNGKALVHILNTYPRDDLFQISVDDLYPIARGILVLAERQRTALFVWRDPFNRFFSCLIYTPRDRYDTRLRQRMVATLEQNIGGTCLHFTTGLSDSPLVRIQALIEIPAGRAAPEVDVAALERRLIDIARGWDEKLADALVIAYGQERGLSLRNSYGAAFPAIYRENVTPLQAVHDLISIERVYAKGNGPELSLQAVPGEPQRIDLRLFHRDVPLALSDVLPQLENLGLRVISEVPYGLTPQSGGMVWVQALSVETKDGNPVEVDPIRTNFLETCYALWAGEVEDDGFNRLVLKACLTSREVVMLRAYAKYLQQARFLPTQAYIQDVLAAHPAITYNLVRLFHARLDIEPRGDDATIVAEITSALEAVTNLAEDEVLRRYLNLIQNTLRTNFYQNKPYVSFKIDSQKITALPLPRPLVEVWVYSPKVEGVHLRGGRVARGGIRWSDRRDDFRTEILGLMKAQMVKNSVIVPVGSKGGFYCKQLPADAKAVPAEVIASYQTFIRGVLDVTDNSIPGGIAPPENVRRRDQDDPYLVVAADKGTAKFSDIANGLSLDYGFWLDDAFASGGSAGYDHKHMGITARGAWEAVKRHFRELGINIQTTPFTCIGVGDMAGDVFGNGMLLSPQTKLVAAFNHKHIFIDPTPDVAVSFAERKRMFELPGSQWSDYDLAKISAGGGVFERSAKSITLSPEARRVLGIEAEKLTPNELMNAILRAPADLLYLGGIGTYVKATDETHADVSDKANDAVRVNGNELRVKVVGEGANLGTTPRARIEYARTGGRINSDAIDNSAGVDTSDHEVNIKIAFAYEMAKGTLTREARNVVLTEMTDEVAGLVLRDNYLQTQILSLEQQAGPQLIEAHGRLIRTLERAGRLDRVVEFLPSNTQISARANEGLTRPEIAILLAYSKMTLFDDLLQSTLPDDAAVAGELLTYFPVAMQQRFKGALENHRLKREIIATVLANDVVNRMGSTFVTSMAERTGYPLVDVVRAWRVVRQVFNLPELWTEIEALDNKAPAAAQIAMLSDIMRIAARAVGTVLAIADHPLDITALVARLTPSLKEMQATLKVDAPAAVEGVPASLLLKLAQFEALAAGPEILVVAAEAKADLAAAAQAYAAIGQRFGFAALSERAEAAGNSGNNWQRQAMQAGIDDLFSTQQQLAVSLLRTGKGNLADWEASQAGEVARVDALLAEVKAAPQLDLAILTVVGKSLRGLAEA